MQRRTAGRWGGGSDYVLYQPRARASAHAALPAQNAPTETVHVRAPGFVFEYQLHAQKLHCILQPDILL